MIIQMVILIQNKELTEKKENTERSPTLVS